MNDLGTIGGHRGGNRHGWHPSAVVAADDAVLVVAGFSSCAPPAAVEALPSAAEALRAAGKRLGATLSAGTCRRSRRMATGSSPSSRAPSVMPSRGGISGSGSTARPRFMSPPRATHFPSGWSTWRSRRPARHSPTGRRAGSFIAGDISRDGSVSASTASIARPPRITPSSLKAADGRAIEPVGLDSEHWQLATAAEGVSLASDIARPARDLPAALVGTTLLRPYHDQRHATMLAHGRVWKTHVVAGRQPDQVTVAFGADASRALILSWRDCIGRAKLGRPYPQD